MTLARSFDVDGILTGPMPSMPAGQVAPPTPTARARVVLDRMLGELWVLGVDNAQAAVGGGGTLLAFAHEVGLVDEVYLEMWSRRLTTCPQVDKDGHHEPCRVWCAYCGVIDPDDRKA